MAGALPLFPLELALRRLIGNAIAARPSFIARLGPYASCTFAVDPIDCPFGFVITLHHGRSSLRLVRDMTAARCDARIAAPLIVLLGMLDGTYDGDALFFSRDLVIEGDIEAVLSLRNAIEDAELDPATVAGLPDGLKPPFNQGMDLVLDRLRRALDAPQPSGSGHGAPHA